MGFFLFLLFFLLLAIFLLFIIASAFLGFVITRVPFVPTPSFDIPLLVDRVRLSDRDTILELGSGNGRVAFLLEKLTRARVIGYEATLWTHWWAQLKKQARRSRATFVFGNFFNHDWSQATAIYIYLYPPLMSRIVEKIQADCRPGTMVISRDFPMSGLRQVDTFRSTPKHRFFIYQV
jgi:SAM-dependent methyltransferase